jgi:SagB-type dehydrogenase family enzyme
MMVARLRQRYAPDARRVLCTFTAVLGVGGCAIAADARAGAPAPPVRPLAELSYAQLRAFIKGVEGIWHEDTAASRGEPAPPVYKPPPDGATLHALVPPERFATRTLSLADAIARRRSRREFLSTPLTIEELSFLLWHTQGVTGALTLPGGETIDLRAAPSGGARYPLETYVFVQRVASLDPGLYRYLPATHQLVVIRHDPQIAATLQRACFGGTLIGDAAAVFAFSAVPYRTEWKYGWISHRMIAMEAGHAVQNLLLSAEAIGAGACAVAAYHQSSLDALLEVDGDSEFTLYLTAVGRVAAAATPEPDTGESRQ